MSKLNSRIESANTNAAKVGTQFFENGGSLVIQRNGDPSSTTHQTVQKDLGPLTGTYAAYCLDAAIGVAETATYPSEEIRTQVIIDTGFAYPEKVAVIKVAAAAEVKDAKA